VSGVALRSISKRFGSTLVLDDVTLDIGADEFLVVLGPSGCGKSTLLRAIAGLESIDSGSIEIDGTRVDRLPPGRRGVAMVFQGYALYPHMSVRENIAFGLRNVGVRRAEIDRRIAEVARMLELERLLDRLPAELSGGQRQRVAIGRAMVRDPKVFLFDEPLSNLDAKLRVEMRTELKKLHHRLGTTIVYVTHDQIEAMTLASRIAIMRDGIVQQFAAPQEIYERPANLYVASFVGSPGMNFIHGDLVSDAGRLGLHLAADGTGRPAFIPLPASLLNKVGPGQKVVLGIRPETITLADAGSLPDARHADMDALIDVLEPTGADTLATLKLGTDQITARLRPSDLQMTGNVARFRVEIERASLFDPESGLRLS
jgi:multiple sugar transport system ATP-binding protein